jgi:glycosyltransferase involved in cell wall biosynthesis
MSLKVNQADFSVLMAVYLHADAEHLNFSLYSLINQSLLPREIVLVCDGPITEELAQVIKKYKRDFEENFDVIFKIVYLDFNVGLGLALNKGINSCKYDIIARFDADDICIQDRFYIQYNYFISSDLDVLGGMMKEFVQNPDDSSLVFTKPLTHMEILNYSKYLNPLCHPTVMFKKESVLRAGSYSDMKLFEDYYLWVRMLKKGYIFGNLDQILVYFRVGDDMIGRRHGLSYFRREFRFYYQSFLYHHLNIIEFVLIVLSKLMLRILPKYLMSLVYKQLMRKKA